MHARLHYFSFFFFNDTATTEIYTLSLHDALPISRRIAGSDCHGWNDSVAASCERRPAFLPVRAGSGAPVALPAYGAKWRCGRDRHVHYGDLQHAALRRT